MTLTTLEPAVSLRRTSNRRAGDDYAELKRLVVSAGLLERDPRRHLGSSLRLLALAAVVVGGVVLTRSSWWVLLWTVPLAVVFGQIGLLAHDATHSQILRTSRQNYVFSLLLFNLCVGGSRGWWDDKHSTHHAQPNRLGTDPDIEGGPIGIDASQALEARGFCRAMMRRQAALITPLLSLAALQMRFQSVGFVQKRRLRNAATEAGLLGVHYALYVGGLVLLLGPGRGALFVLIHQMLLGLYLGGTFLTSHAGMRVLHPGEQMDFLHRQVLTARDIRSSPIADYTFGPLSCQIEHHLFPTMPRYALREAASIVRTFCAEREIPYVEAGAFEAFGAVFRHLSAVARYTGRSLAAD
jgi:fatty acid desaturase